MKDAGRQRVRQRILGFGTWCVALLVGTALFHALGDGRLAPPPLDPSAWVPWIEDRDALIATMALLRLVVLGLCWYLVGVTTVGTIARLLRAARLTRIADALTLPIVRRLLQQTLGVVLATAMVTAATGPSLTVPPAPVQVAADVGDDHGRAGPAAETPGSGSEVRSPAPHRTGVGIAQRSVRRRQSGCPPTVPRERRCGACRCRTGPRWRPCRGGSLRPIRHRGGTAWLTPTSPRRLVEPLGRIGSRTR
jgi:hypothetical protein